MKSREHVGNPIYIWRVSNGLTINEVAEKVGVTPVTISRWERCQTKPDLLYIKLLAEQGCGLKDLLSYYDYDEKVRAFEKMIEEKKRETKEIKKIKEYKRSISPELSSGFKKRVEEWIKYLKSKGEIQ